MVKIESFHGKYRFLSNFYPAEVELDGVVYPTVEHAYQAAKTENKIEREWLRKAKTPGEAKKMGDAMVKSVWFDNKKVEIMENLVFQKFQNNQALQDQLLRTEEVELVEGNHWNDVFWGVCRGVGENHLGKILMRTRAKIRMSFVKEKKKGCC